MAPPADHAQIQALQNELARIPRNRTVFYRLVEHMFDHDSHRVQYNAPGHVISLRLDFMALTRLPETLPAFPFLEKLIVPMNDMTELPPWIGALMPNTRPRSLPVKFPRLSSAAATPHPYATMHDTGGC